LASWHGACYIVGVMAQTAKSRNHSQGIQGCLRSKPSVLETASLGYLIKEGDEEMKLLWNKEKTASVVASKIREICIYPRRTGNGGTIYEVKGWYNKNEYFYFGFFQTEKEAQEFIKKVEG